ncbi:MAG: ubiquitin-activating E1 FCCH domain-containing protein [Pseudomonadales bacterium]
MAKASGIQTAFNGGEWSPLMDARVDLSKYGNSLATMINYIPMVQGPAKKRPGTRFVARTKYSDRVTELIDFEFSVEQPYILEFGDLYIRFFKDHSSIFESTKTITAATAADPVVITSTAHLYLDGDEILIDTIVGMTELNSRRFLVSNKTANTYELQNLDGVDVDGTAFTAYSSGGTSALVHEVVTAYPQTDVHDLKYAQSADVMYLTHPSHKQRKLSRTGDTSWTLEDIAFKDGPYLGVNTTDTKMTLSGSTGSVTVTISATTGVNDDEGFKSTDVDRVIRWENNNGDWVWLIITAFTSTTQVTATIQGDGDAEIVNKAITNTTQADPVVITSNSHGLQNGDKIFITGVGGMVELNTNTYIVANKSTNNFDLEEVTGGTVDGTGFGAYTSGGTINTDRTESWRLGVWSDTTGYPSTVTFFGDRLYFAGNPATPDRLDGSTVGDYENFAPTDTDGTVIDDNAVSFTLNANNVNAIRWIIDDEKGLLAGTAGGEWVIKGSTQNEIITPTSIDATRSKSFGSANISPVRADASILFIQRAGRKLRELGYVFENDGFTAPDMTLFSEHITLSGMVRLAYQQEPASVVWAVRADGVLLGFTYQRDQDVTGWHRHFIGGVDAKVKSVAAIPAPTEDRDDAWIIVERTVNGQTVQFVEFLTKLWENGDDVKDAFFVDAGSTYDGAPVTTITGLEYLEGETVTILADGSTHPTKVVTDASITLDRSSSKVHVGKGYDSDMEPLKPELGSEDGTAQGKMKRTHKLFIRMFQSVGGSVGRDENNLEVINFRKSSDPMNQPVPLFTGDKRVSLNTRNDRDDQFYWRHSDPLPSNILAFIRKLVTND